MIRGYGCVPREVVENAALSEGARLLYVELLCLPHGPDGTVVATYAQLAGRLGVSPSAIKRRVRDLAGHGLIEWRRGRRGRPNRYLPLEVVPRSRPLPRALPGGAVSVESGVQVLAVAAEPAAEREDRGGVVDAEPGHGAGVGAARASCGSADAYIRDGGDRVRVACHDAEVTSGYGGWGWSP